MLDAKTMVQLGHIQNLADVDVWVIGDAAHQMPILGGESANQVINHAFDLAEHLLNLSTSNKSVFLERNDRDWRTAVHESEKRLSEMHGQQIASPSS